jgi:hypothetical protein
MQNGIILLVDVDALLEERRVENNVYFLDNTKKLGSIGEGTTDLTTNIVGALNPDGSIAGEAVMNWLPYGIAAAPNPVLRVAARRDHGTARFHELLAELKTASPANVAKIVARHEKIANQHECATFERKDGRHHEIPMAFAHPSGASKGETTVSAGDLSPLISDITGPAVDNGVLYPAQYGSPDAITEGWYWSATVDTHKTGLHVYQIHLLVHRPVGKKGEPVVWKPETFVVNAKINVTAGTIANGFTGYGPGVLPLVPQLTAA